MKFLIQGPLNYTPTFPILNVGKKQAEEGNDSSSIPELTHSFNPNRTMMQNRSSNDILIDSDEPSMEDAQEQQRKIKQKNEEYEQQLSEQLKEINDDFFSRQRTLNRSR